LPAGFLQPRTIEWNSRRLLKTRFSFSLGRIALLGLTQLQIRASRSHIPLNRHRRKQLPSVIQTLGDYIQAKRYEKGLHPYQVAAKLWIAASLVSAWERGASTPDERPMRSNGSR
jgi:DNA-binding transcriptional regulator YiaG